MLTLRDYITALQNASIIQADVEVVQVQGRVAIKFFVDRRAFEMETYVCSLASLKPVLVGPELLLSNTKEAIACPQGQYIFPAFTVAQEGEPLQHWMEAKNNGDFITAVQVRNHHPPRHGDLQHETKE